MVRAPCCEKVGLKRGRWTAEEDEILTKYILANGEGSWRSLPKNAGLLRCGKSCRLRWINYLRADLKRGNITKEEEETIVKLHTAFGNRWSLIAAHLPGRTDNEIKNYWNSHLSRKIYSFSKNESLTTAAATTINIANIGGPCKYKGGRVSRSAAMKNQNTSTLMLIGKAKSTETKDKEAIIINESKENLGLSLETQENEGKQIMGLGPTNELEDSTTTVSDLDVPGGGERLNAPEGWGPYEWLDSEINRLKYFLEADHQAVDPSGNHHTINKEEEEEEEEESGDFYNNCGSPVNSGFDEEWYNLSFDWDSTIRGINVNDDRQNDLWDEGDKILSWLWS